MKAADPDSEFPMPMDDDEPFVPLDDDSAVLPPPDANQRDSSIDLQLNVDRDDLMNLENERAETSMGGLDQSDLTTTTPGRTGAQPTRKRVRRSLSIRRMRKRRNVVVDNDATELTNEYITSMLQNTSDIVRQDTIHPADWVHGKQPVQKPPKKQAGRKLDYDHQHHTNHELLFAFLPYDKLMARPHLADDGQLANELLRLWKLNSSRVVGKPFPYRKRGAVPATATAQQEDEETPTKTPPDGEEDIEMTRRREDEEEEDHQRPSLDDDFEPPMQQDDQVDQDFPPPNDDDDEMPPPLDDDDDDDARRKSFVGEAAHRQSKLFGPFL
jgi:hypothetical protein